MNAAGVRSWAMSDVGAVRSHNEDSLVNRPELGLWAVADGAGGHEAGEVAAQMIADALNAIPSGLSTDEMVASMCQRLHATHEALRAEAARRGPHVTIASTIVALIIRNGHFACLWAGDSRAYLMRGGRLQQVSHDHSLVQELVDAGRITSEEAEHHPHANIITRAIGSGDEPLKLDKVIGEVLPADRLLLCSDGVSKTLTKSELGAMMQASNSASPAERIISAALARGANDNVTVVLVEALE